MMLYYGIDIISKKLIQKGLGIQQSFHFDKELIFYSDPQYSFYESQSRSPWKSKEL